MRQNRRPRPFLRLAALTVAAAAGGLVWATPASAAQGTRPCPSYYYCFYENVDYNKTASGWTLNYNSTVEGDFNKPPAAAGNRRNQLSSIINNGNRTICIYDDRTAQKDDLIAEVWPYKDVANLHNSSRGDKADYWRIYGGKVTCPR